MAAYSRVHHGNNYVNAFWSDSCFLTYDSPTSDGLPVTGIGRAKAEKIWFRALTTIHLDHQLRGRPHRHPRGGR